MFIYLKTLVFIILSIVNQSVFAIGDTENIVTGKDAIGVIHEGEGNVIINKTTNTGIPLKEFLALSQELSVSQSALKSFFKILEKEQVPSEDLDSTLREIAKRYKDLLAKVDTLNSNDESVKLLITQAKQALEAGEFEKAESLFNQAKKTDIDAAKQILKQAQEQANERLVSAAESAAANGDLKMTQLAYKEAGEYYQEAAELLPVGNDEKLAKYLNWAGQAFYYAGLYD